MLLTEEKFENLDFTSVEFKKGEYEYCTFHNCNLSGAALNDIKFLECVFSSCNISNAPLKGTAFRMIKFIGCKMLGLRFDSCDKFGLNIQAENCTLDYSTFYQTNLRKTTFTASSFQSADFTECDLTGAIFNRCDLTGARFENTILEKADFRTAYNYSLDPELNRIKKARFSYTGLGGLLDKYHIEIE